MKEVINNSYIYNNYIIGLGASDFGRYIALCIEDMRYPNSTIKRKDLDEIIKTKHSQTKIFYTTLIKQNIIFKISSREMKLNFNILNYLGIGIDNIENFSLSFESNKHSMLWLGHTMKLVSFMFLEGKYSLRKIDVQQILGIDHGSTPRTLKEIKHSMKYKNKYIFEDDENNLKILRMNPVFEEIEKYNCIYRFLNKQGEILYIGSTKKLKSRMKVHFGKNSHLPKELYEEIERIEYCSFRENSSDMYIYEVYYINKYLPKFNSKDKGSNMTVTLPDVQWENFDFSYLLDEEQDIVDC